METIISRASSDGRGIQIAIEHSRWLVALVDGARHGERESAPRQLARPVTKAGKTYSHHIGGVAITAAEAAQVSQALREATGIAPTPRLSPEAERAELVAHYESLISRQQDAYDRSYEAGMTYDAAIESATARLEAFDRQHPEVLRQIQAERAEAAQANLWR